MMGMCVSQNPRVQSLLTGRDCKFISSRRCHSRFRRQVIWSAGTIARAAEDKLVTLPLETAVDRQLLPLDSTNTPLWSTFCGLSNGVWRGKAAAFYAATGKAEAVYLDEKKPVKDIYTLVVEDRIKDDVVLRKTLRSPKWSDIRDASMQPSENPENLEWEEEQILESEEGLAIFDGGTFSRGPQRLLGSDLDATSTTLPSRSAEDVKETLLGQNGVNGVGTPAEAIAKELASQPDWGEISTGKNKVSMIELCLANGGECRLRLQVTVSTGVEDGELDLEVLRIVLWSESWSGLAETCQVDKCIDDNTRPLEEMDVTLSQAPRTGPKSLEGKWKAYDISAVPVTEEDPLTGEQSSVMLYFNKETEEVWREAGKEHKDSGYAVWLPSRSILELRMVKPSSRGRTGDKAEEMSTAPAAGLLISFTWICKDNTAISVHREYDGNGELMECRYRSAINGNWVGGRM